MTLSWPFTVTPKGLSVPLAPIVDELLPMVKLLVRAEVMLIAPTSSTRCPFVCVPAFVGLAKLIPIDGVVPVGFVANCAVCDDIGMTPPVQLVVVSHAAPLLPINRIAEASACTSESSAGLAAESRDLGDTPRKSRMGVRIGVRSFRKAGRPKAAAEDTTRTNNVKDNERRAFGIERMHSVSIS